MLYRCKETKSHKNLGLSKLLLHNCRPKPPIIQYSVYRDKKILGRSKQLSLYFVLSSLQSKAYSSQSKASLTPKQGIFVPKQAKREVAKTSNFSFILFLLFKFLYYLKSCEFFPFLFLQRVSNGCCKVFVHRNGYVLQGVGTLLCFLNAVSKTIG